MCTFTIWPWLLFPLICNCHQTILKIAISDMIIFAILEKEGSCQPGKIVTKAEHKI